MAQKTVVTFVCDLPHRGEAEVEANPDNHHEFEVDGVAYVLDLCDPDDKKFEKALAPFLVHKVRRTPHRVTSRAGRPSLVHPTDEVQAVRAWAIENGYDVAPRGRIAGPIWEAYREAALSVVA